MLFWRLIFFKTNFFKKFFQKQYRNVKQFGSRSGLTLCRSWSGSKLFAKVISWKIFMFFSHLLTFSKSTFKLFQEYYWGVKQLGSRSGPTLCQSWSGSKLFAKVISWKIMHAFLSSVDFFLKSTFSNKLLQEHYRKVWNFAKFCMLFYRLGIFFSKSTF